VSRPNGSRQTPGRSGAGAKPPPLCRDALRRRRSTTTSTWSCGRKRGPCSGSGQRSRTCSGSWSRPPRGRCVSACDERARSQPGTGYVRPVLPWERGLSGAPAPSAERLEQAVPPLPGPGGCRVSELAGRPRSPGPGGEPRRSQAGLAFPWGSGGAGAAGTRSRHRLHPVPPGAVSPCSGSRRGPWCPGAGPCWRAYPASCGAAWRSGTP